MNAVGGWVRHVGVPYRRMCARPGCGSAAVVTLRFQPTLRQAWLADLDEDAPRSQGDLCNRHATSLVLPRGWELHDDRAEKGPVSAPESPPQQANGKSLRPTRSRTRSAASDQPADQLPGFEPVVVPMVVPTEYVDADEPAAGRTVPAQFGANDDDPADEGELNAILDARTPLLQRAFRNAQPRG